MSFGKYVCAVLAVVVLLLALPLPSDAAFEGSEQIVLALDPGHGGSSVGSSAYGVGEKIYTWRLACCLKQYLDENGSFKVYLTRSGDYDMEICERGIFANDCNADALISLHFDGSADRSQRGVTVYTSVFEDTALVSLGRAVATAVACSVGLDSNGVKQKSDTEGYYWNFDRQWDIKDPSLGVLSDYYGIPTWAAKFGIPSMIVEHGFLSSTYDRDIISAEGSIEKMARAEADAIIAYYTNHTHTYGAMRRDYPSNCVFQGKQSEHCAVCGHRRNVQSLDPAPDNHYWQDTVTTPAACGRDGSISGKCRITENLIEKGYKNIVTHEVTQIIPAPTQHDYSAVATVAATHLTDGYIQYKCSFCSDSFKDILYAEGHSYELSEHREPTCTEAGGYVYLCTVCQNEYMEKDAAALGHSYTLLEETRPTCTEAGSRTSRCDVCDYVLAEELAPTGHDTSLCEYTAPTCVRRGRLLGTCAVCGKSIDERIPASGHSIAVNVIKTATCTEAGEEELTCDVCGNVTHRTVKALGHDLLLTSYIDPECTEPGHAELVCARCGKSESGDLSPAGHSWETLTYKEPGIFTSGSQRSVCRACHTMEIETLEPSVTGAVNFILVIIIAVCLVIYTVIKSIRGYKKYFSPHAEASIADKSTSRDEMPKAQIPEPDELNV